MNDSATEAARLSGKILLACWAPLTLRKLGATDVRLAVRDQPGQCLVQGVERAVAGRVAEHLASPGDARGDAAHRVLPGGLRVLGTGPALELGPVPEVQHRLAAETPGRASRQPAQRHGLLGHHA